MVATVMPTMGFGGYFIPLLAGVFYYATPETTGANSSGTTSPTGPPRETSR